MHSQRRALMGLSRYFRRAWHERTRRDSHHDRRQRRAKAGVFETAYVRPPDRRLRGERAWSWVGCSRSSIYCEKGWKRVLAEWDEEVYHQWLIRSFLCRLRLLGKGQ